MPDENLAEELTRFFLTIGLPALPDDWDDRIRLIHQRVVDVNQRVNLTRITGADEFLIKHIADSLLLLAVRPDLPAASLKLIDVGCGAGFPGLPLAMICRPSHFVELDSNAKKVAFVDDLITTLNLTNCRAEQGRARELAGISHHREAYDLVLARAVGNTPKLIRECRHLLAPRGGRFYIYKTPRNIAREMMETQRAAARAGLQVTRSPVFTLPANAGQRQFWILERTTDG